MLVTLMWERHMEGHSTAFAPMFENVHGSLAEGKGVAKSLSLIPGNCEEVGGEKQLYKVGF